MSEESPSRIKLNDVMFAVLDHAVGSVVDSGGPLIPFSMVEDEHGKRSLSRFLADRLEEGQAQAQKSIEDLKDRIVRYAFAWDGFVTIDGRRWDAILVEAGDKSGEPGVLLCQRYEKKGLFRKRVSAVGNPAMIEEPASRIG